VRSPATTPEALRVPCPRKARMMDADEFRALIALLGGGYNRPGPKDQLGAALTELQPEKLVGFTDQLALAAYAPTGRASAQRTLARNPHAQRNASFSRMPARFRGALSSESRTALRRMGKHGGRLKFSE
jgi:hypothetical protein